MQPRQRGRTHFRKLASVQLCKHLLALDRWGLKSAGDAAAPPRMVLGGVAADCRGSDGG